jgi:ferredoxin/flavodoxin
LSYPEQEKLKEGSEMKIKKTYALYFSPTGTTQKAVVAFAEGTGAPVEIIDLTLPPIRKAFRRSFTKDELVVAGLPVYAGRLPKELDDFFCGLEGNGASAAALIMYGNREYDDALIELEILLKERDFEVKAGAAFIGEHTFSKNIAAGRPDAGDLAIAARFGSQTAASISDEVQGTLKLKGHFPYVMPGYDPAKPGPHPTFFAITTTELCVNCGHCAENCPWSAIDMDNHGNINAARCMRCLRCLKNCPVSAKEIKDEKFLAFLPQFEARLNSRRCEPELYLRQ